jgi:pyrroline-5-carboxylate reductase
LLTNKKVAFLGAGSMAEAMISGIINAGEVSKQQVVVTNRSNQERLDDIQAKYGTEVMPLDKLNFNEIDIVVLAMKPKDADKALESLKMKIKSHQLVLSVLAGITTKFMEDRLPTGQQVIRVMPNTSSMLQESATAISPGQHTTQNNISAAKSLLSCIGEVYIIEEKQMDVFTGIAGSGPAYFYYLMEHIEKAGVEGGLDAEEAREIGAQTILGAAKMMLERDESPSELRENVTSPNGTTAAGLKALHQHGGGKAITKAVKGAQKRSKEISDQLEEKILI